MNWQEILQFFANRIISSGTTSLVSGDMAFPNQRFEAGNRSAWLELAVSPDGYQSFTETLSLYPAHVDLVVAVPVGTGVERSHELARRIASLFSPQLADRCGWNVNSSILIHVKRVQQLPSAVTQTVCRTNVRVTVNVYEELVTGQNET